MMLALALGGCASTEQIDTLRAEVERLSEDLVTATSELRSGQAEVERLKAQVATLASLRQPLPPNA